ncbi:hypothetical protein GCM10009804_10690 [Kribbella hippodromi]|uniref:Prevent-host-death family protein n=1 Tax=Kribbella hippodromi TaxID=434347 RepID=A0ABP4N804_9ACTN
MDPEETQHQLPDGTTVWVLSTSEAATNLPALLQLFREGKSEPLIFGAAGQPEAAVVPFEVWRALTEAATDQEGFDSSYSVARQRLANPGAPSVPLDDVAAELGWDLDDDTDDAEFRKPR